MRNLILSLFLVANITVFAEPVIYTFNYYWSPAVGGGEVYYEKFSMVVDYSKGLFILHSSNSENRFGEDFQGHFIGVEQDKTFPSIYSGRFAGGHLNLDAGHTKVTYTKVGEVTIIEGSDGELEGITLIFNEDGKHYIWSFSVDPPVKVE